MYLYLYNLYVSGRCVNTLVGVVVGGGGVCGRGATHEMVAAWS